MEIEIDRKESEEKGGSEIVRRIDVIDTKQKRLII